MDDPSGAHPARVPYVPRGGHFRAELWLLLVAGLLLALLRAGPDAVDAVPVTPRAAPPGPLAEPAMTRLLPFDEALGPAPGTDAAQDADDNPPPSLPLRVAATPTPRQP